jgi:hypothetical protein
LTYVLTFDVSTMSSQVERRALLTHRARHADEHGLEARSLLSGTESPNKMCGEHLIVPEPSAMITTAARQRLSGM